MDLQHLIERAKEIILKDGEHPPILYAETKDGKINLFYFADFPDTTKEKQYTLFGLGRKYGIECPGSENKIAHLYFVVEAWMSTNRNYNRPSEDPNRKEALTILHLDVSTMKTTLDRAEMLRDGSGELVDLLTLEPMVKGVEDNLLPAFLAGTRSAKMSDAELMRKLTGQG